MGIKRYRLFALLAMMVLPRNISVIKGSNIVFEPDSIVAEALCDTVSTAVPVSNDTGEYLKRSGKFIGDHVDSSAAYCSGQAIGNMGRSLYSLPYSLSSKSPDWHRLWINTATLSGAFIGTLLVLECLPEDATSWNRSELQDVPLFERWNNHVIKEGPEWDHDKFYFNYILHPYAGAVYYMSARSCGFNAWQSLLYCACISTIGWEFGIEAFMERPSYQDIFITPLVGSFIGECFYKVKRNIVENGYRLCGSSVLGNIVAFLIDPVNEVVGLFAGNPCRQMVKSKRRSAVMNSSLVVPTSGGVRLGVSVSCLF